MSFIAIFGITAVGVGAALLQTHRKASRVAGLEWQELLEKVQPICASGVTAIALDYLQPCKGQTKIETDELWEMVGGLEGVRKMYANAEVLIALAGYAQRWNPSESLIVAERMRRDGVALRRAARKLLIDLTLGFGRARGPFNVQEAASAYYLMQQRLLALYESSHAGRYPELAAAM